MTPDERAQLLSGTAYVDPNDGWRPITARTFGTELRMVHQSYEDITQPGEAERRMAAVLRDVYQQMAALSKRVTLLEAHAAVLYAALGSDL